jgi:hypothetical protein
MPLSVGSVSDVDATPTAVPPLTPSPLTVEGIREMGDDMSVKLNKYHKPRLIEAIVVCMARIDLLEASDSNIRSDGNANVRAELRELKVAVFASVSNAALTQDTQDVLDRPNVGWDDIHKLARGASWHEEQNPAPLHTAPLTAVEDTPPARDGNVAPPVGESGTGENDKLKLAKRVKLARSTDLWCLSPFTPVTQEARDKPRKVCPLNLRGEVCTASNCGNKHPKVCLVADHSKGKIPKATCSLWHMRVPFAGNAGNVGNVTGRRNGFNHPPGSKGSKAKVAVRPVKPDTKLAKLMATALAEELKARIRTAKMMSQGVSYSQMVQAHAPVHVMPAQTSALAPAPAPAPAPAQVAPRVVRTALTPDEAIRILLDAVDRLQQ